MPYRRCGRSGLQLPAVSLGLWHNFGHDRPLDDQRGDPAPRVRPRHHALRPGQQLRPAVRLRGGELRPPPRDRLRALPRRADHLDQGRLRHVARPVRRVGLAQVPARLARPEPRRGWASTTSTSSTRTASTPTRRCEETMGALDTAVRQGKALYAGISSYSAERTREAAAILRELGTPLLIHQPSYSMLNRWIEPELLDVLGEEGIGCDRVLAARPGDADRQVPRRRAGGLARRRGQLPRARLPHRGEPRARARAERDRRSAAARRCAQMAVAWTLRDPRVTSALIGASSVAQLEQNVAALDEPRLLRRRSWPRSTATRSTSGINLWAASSDA